jgi:hypothetical protein
MKNHVLYSLVAVACGYSLIREHGRSMVVHGMGMHCVAIHGMAKHGMRVHKEDFCQR